MYHVVVVKDEGVTLEGFSSLESAIENAEANTEDSEVERIAIFRGFTEIAEWFPVDDYDPAKHPAQWYYYRGKAIWREGHPSALLKEYRILKEKGTPKVEDCEVDCHGRIR